jgi:cyclopropane fatty-acyl-phospholipid synthase-like methyltransferase
MPKSMSSESYFDVGAAYDVDNYLYFIRDLVTDALSEQEVKFFINSLELNNNSTVLDLPCGYGRHSNILAKYVLSVIGVDISDDYLAIARKNAQFEGVEVQYIKDDMRTIRLGKYFDAVIMVFTSFAMFGHKENINVLDNIARHLKDRGKFCIELMNPSYLGHEFKRDYVFEKEGNLMIDRLNYNRFSNRFTSRRIYIKGGKRVDAMMSHEIFSKEQLDVIFSLLNLKITEIFSSCTGTLFSSDSHKMILIGEKVV